MKQKLISDFQRQIEEIYTSENLNSLSSIDKLDGKYLLFWYHDVTRNNGFKLNQSLTYVELYNDLLLCSDEMIYFTAHLFLYRPFINNPLKNRNPNLEGKRYNMFADIVGQKTYNYWDRIGDLIASFFPGKIKATSIYFHNSLDCVSNELKNSENFRWLQNFRDAEYKVLNEKRKKIVHYQTTNTDYTTKYAISGEDTDALKNYHLERENLPEYYQRHIHLSVVGFEKTLKFLEEVNNTLA
jgi:hypothetical protein